MTTFLDYALMSEVSGDGWSTFELRHGGNPRESRPPEWEWSGAYPMPL